MNNMDFELPLPVTVTLTGTDGNAFNIIGRTTSAMRRQLRVAGWNYRDIEAICNVYRMEAISSDYNNVIQTTIKYVKVN